MRVCTLRCGAFEIKPKLESSIDTDISTKLSSVFKPVLFSYSTGTSTSTLTKHMHHEHNIEIKTDREETKQRKLTDIFITVGEKKTQLNQSSNQSSDEQFMLGRRLALWICKDLLPFKAVENNGFKDLWKSLQLGMSLPCRKTISVSAIDDMYRCMKTALVTRLSTNGGMCIDRYVCYDSIKFIYSNNLIVLKYNK